MKSGIIQFQGLPRLLTKIQAAAYCGIGVQIFSAVCPVKPLSLGASSRSNRFDRFAIDAWIDRMRGENADPDYWLNMLESGNDNDPRKRA